MIRKITIIAAAALAASLAHGADTTEIGLAFDGAAGWNTVTAGQGTASIEDESAVLAPTGGYVGVFATLPPEASGAVLSLRVAVESKGDNQIEVRFGEDAATAPVWAAALSGNKKATLAARIAPPLADGALTFQIGAGGTGTVTLSKLDLVAEPAPEPPTVPPMPGLLAPDWQPDGTLDATERSLGNETELQAAVKSITVSFVPDTTVTLGSFAPVIAMVDSQGDARTTLELTGEFPNAIAFDDRSFPITKRRTDRASLRIQGLQTGTYWGKVIASSDDVRKEMPIKVAVTRGYPAFGVTTSAGDAPGRPWQLQEMLVDVTPEMSAADIVARIEPRIANSPLIPAIYFSEPPTASVTEGVVKALAGRVGLYSAAFRANRPFAGGDLDAEAARLVEGTSVLLGAVLANDPTAAVVSPVFHYTAGVPGTPEQQLLSKCLELRLGDHFNALAVDAPPLAAGGVLGESVGGDNVKSASAFWASNDARAARQEIDAALAAHQVRVPILTTGIGGTPSVDERLDALKIARAMALATYAGATGATFTEVQTPEAIGLTHPDGSLTTSGWAVRELSRELAGAVPLMRSWRSESKIEGWIGEPVVLLPFVRERETILVMWNNGYGTRRVSLELADPPITEHTLTISHDDPCVEREYNPAFTFSKQALQERKQNVYIVLGPLEMKVLRYRQRLAVPSWLSSVEWTKEPPHGRRGTGREVDDRPWWQKLQDWAEGKDE